MYRSILAGIFTYIVVTGYCPPAKAASYIVCNYVGADAVEAIAWDNSGYGYSTAGWYLVSGCGGCKEVFGGGSLPTIYGHGEIWVRDKIYYYGNGTFQGCVLAGRFELPINYQGPNNQMC